MNIYITKEKVIIETTEDLSKYFEQITEEQAKEIKDKQVGETKEIHKKDIERATKVEVK